MSAHPTRISWLNARCHDGAATCGWRLAPLAADAEKRVSRRNEQAENLKEQVHYHCDRIGIPRGARRSEYLQAALRKIKQPISSFQVDRILEGQSRGSKLTLYPLAKLFDVANPKDLRKPLKPTQVNENSTAKAAMVKDAIPRMRKAKHADLEEIAALVQRLASQPEHRIMVAYLLMSYDDA